MKKIAIKGVQKKAQTHRVCFYITCKTIQRCEQLWDDFNTGGYK